MNGRPYDIETRRALYAATQTLGYGRWHLRPEPGIALRRNGHVITVASAHLPYAISRHGLGGIRHAVRAVYLAWRRGELVGQLVLCWCCARLVTAELVDAEAPARDNCPMCLVRLMRPRSARVTATVTVEAVT